VPARTKCPALTCSVERSQAATAAHVVAFTAFCLDRLRAVFRAAFPGAKIEKERDYWRFAGSLGCKPAYVWIFGLRTDRVIAEGDPFGHYADDGKAALWIWRDFPAKQQFSQTHKAGASRCAGSHTTARSWY